MALSFSFLTLGSLILPLPPCLCPSLLTHTDAAIAQVGRHNEASSLVDTHAHEASVHASDEATHTHHDGRQGAAVIAGGRKGQRDTLASGVHRRGCTQSHDFLCSSHIGTGVCVHIMPPPCAQVDTHMLLTNSSNPCWARPDTSLKRMDCYKREVPEEGGFYSPGTWMGYRPVCCFCLLTARVVRIAQRAKEHLC